MAAMDSVEFMAKSDNFDEFMNDNESKRRQQKPLTPSQSPLISDNDNDNDNDQSNDVRNNNTDNENENDQSNLKLRCFLVCVLCVCVSVVLTHIAYFVRYD